MELLIKIDETNSDSKSLIDYLKKLSYVKLSSIKKKEIYSYNQEFIEKMNEAALDIENGNYKTLNSDNVWESLGLK